MKAESEGGMYRSPREPDHVIPSPFARRVVTIRPRQRVRLGLIGSSWAAIAELIELGRRRTREVLFGEQPAIGEPFAAAAGGSRSGAAAS